ncbi:MAG TPA: glycoside hydrolase family 2 TIM barrel-domain containing protein, partial [Terriglobia bacterium]|nr:glycoside hydrolase family 2 TIM barrel-domain containing protein [Terriglobia bacterium]
SGQLPESSRSAAAGKVRQNRNYFWYRKTFVLSSRRAVAILKINKAQFGTAIWMNGHKVGEYPGCFSAAFFNVTNTINWNGENILLVRVGAHPGVLPPGFPTGTDFEKLKWTPGIYDDVSLKLSDNPVIESIQVAPHLQPPEIVVQTKIKNFGSEGSYALSHQVSAWNDKRHVATSSPETLNLRHGEERVLTQTIRIPNPILWTPETPFLYRLDTTTGGDASTVRFGLREFRFETASRRALLNGRVYYLRGSNVTFHRFLEDPLSSSLPWDERWVRRLLVEIPKKMHWNSFRFCIGPVPDRWLDIADEAGLLIQNEFFVWTGAPDWDPNYSRKWDPAEMVRQFGDWMRDNWNHPSVAIWDANNETRDPVFGEKIIPAVRSLDLSNRPWENSYNPPVDPDDPVEEHPYLLQSMAMGNGNFNMTDLEKMFNDRTGPLPVDDRAKIINEYGWLWLNRDGSPTLLTQKLYSKLLGPVSSPEQRFAMDAYLLAGKTEFWRALRRYAGILHFVYLTGSYPGVYTSDHFLDVQKLQLEPHFSDYLSEAFKPLGLYVNFWKPKLEAASSPQIQAVLTNDEYSAIKGQLVLSLDADNGREVTRTESPFTIEALGQASYSLTLKMPAAIGKYTLKAVAKPADSGSQLPTLSRRRIEVVGRLTKNDLTGKKGPS